MKTVYGQLGGRQAICTKVYGESALETGDYAHARPLLEKSLDIWRPLGHKHKTSLTLRSLADLARRRRHRLDTGAADSRGSNVWRATEGGAVARGDFCGAGRAGNSLARWDREDREQAVAAVRAALGEEAFTRTFAVGRSLSCEQAIVTVWEVVELL